LRKNSNFYCSTVRKQPSNAKKLREKFGNCGEKVKLKKVLLFQNAKERFLIEHA